MNILDSSHNLTASELHQIDAICDDFESRLRAGMDEDITTVFCGNFGEEPRAYLLTQLIRIEIEAGGGGYSHGQLQHYRSLFPEDVAAIEKLFETMNLTRLGDSLGRTVRMGKLKHHAEPLLSPGTEFDKYTIIDQVGRGSFGVVYHAFDNFLNRNVALKIARSQMLGSPEKRTRFIDEARSCANIKANGIAMIYDIKVEKDNIYIVQEFVPGQNLSQALAQRSFSSRESVTLIMAIATALHNVHREGIFHRDLKPSNVILGEDGRPTVVDFGLAWNASSHQGGQESICGTPSYMSPEQVRGEVNRTDAGTDIWGLGVILYEMLTGKRPFDGARRKDIYHNVLNEKPMSLRACDPSIPKELNRITLKCLARKKSDRYATATQLSEDLQRFLDAAGESTEPVAEPSVEIVPKGLRAFSEEDQAFFLDLLPGPRDHSGIPVTVRFWKNRIEDSDSLSTFPVGVIFGPSGCGKSSFVRAGLLPQLGSQTNVICLDATPHETGIRLIKALRQQFPALPNDISLPEAFAMIRDEGLLLPGEKLLVVIDQFEQWLSVNQRHREAQLANTLRHCDGSHIQTLLLVRADFWPAMTRFMDDLEIPLVQGDNCKMIDLLDPEHAAQVLTKFGRAYGRFSDDRISTAQQTFIDRAIEQLTEEGKVVCVRLALFAEMFRGRTWTPSTLQETGGADGVGVAFLHDTFTSDNAPREYRAQHREAAACLAALLPETGSNIKGHMRSREELMVASGCERNPQQFDRLLHLLDKELRLITPTHPVGEREQETEPVDHVRTGEYFQLSHDYLVTILRRWIDSERQRTFRGRTQSRLTQISSTWATTPSRRYLPTWWEHVRILLFSDRKSWTELQQKMVRASFWYHLPGTLIGAVLLSLMLLGGFQTWDNFRNREAVVAIKQTMLADIEAHVGQINARKRSLVPMLREELGHLVAVEPQGEFEQQKNNQERVKVAMALALLDSSNWDLIQQGLYTVPKDQLHTLADFLRPEKEQYQADLMTELQANPTLRSERAVRQAITLAYWGHPQYLVSFVLEQPPTDTEPLFKVLANRPQQAVASLQTELQRLQTRVWSHPDPQLATDLQKYHGVVHRNGAVAGAVPIDEHQQLLKNMFDNGYVPVSFRPFHHSEKAWVAIAWQRNTKFVDLSFTECIRTDVGLTEKDLQQRFSNMQDQGWHLIDFSYSEALPVAKKGPFSAVWNKNVNGVNTVLDLNLTIERFDELWGIRREGGFQVERCLTRTGESGEPRYSVIWRLDENDIVKGELRQPRTRLRTEPNCSQTQAQFADCQIERIDLSRKNLFEVYQEAYRRKGHIEYVLANPHAEIQGDKVMAVAAYARQLQRLGRLTEARVLFERIIESYPRWKTNERFFAFLLSIDNDFAALEAENARVVLGRVQTPLFLLRFAAANGRAIAEEQGLDIEVLYQRVQENIEGGRKALADNVEMMDFFQLWQISADLLLARISPVGSPERTRLNDQAMDALQERMKENQASLLVDWDFDLLRNRQEFQDFLRRKHYDLRITKSWRLSDEVTSQRVECASEDDLVQEARLRLADGYRPRCLSSAWDLVDHQLYSQTIWEKTATQAADPRDFQRLANVSLLLSRLGQHELLKSVLAGRYGEQTLRALPVERRRSREATTE